MDPSITIRSLTQADADKCESIMRSLPAWFGIESAIVDYRRSLDTLETYLACIAPSREAVSGMPVGFLALNHHNEFTSEIHVMAVAKEYHGLGVGTELLRHIEERLKAQSVEYLEVKTLGPSKPDPYYDQTRRFYLSQGFRPIEETDLWGENNPCLIMVKHLSCSGGRR